MPSPIETKTAGVVDQLRAAYAKFGRNEDAASRAASLGVRATQTYGIEREVLLHLATKRPSACGPSIRAALIAPPSKWSEPLLLEVIALADAIDGKTTVVVNEPAKLVVPVEIPTPVEVGDE